MRQNDCVNDHFIESSVHMAKHKLIAIDLAKNIFQVCTVNNALRITLNKSLGRVELAAFIQQQETTTIVMEACYSSHYWARTFEAMGHTVKLLPAQHVKPFVRGNKSDHNDASAIAEASMQPNITTVPVKVSTNKTSRHCIESMNDTYHNEQY